MQAIKDEGGFRYVETNRGKPVLLLLHGLFGALSNFKDLIEGFGKDYNVVVPILPIYELDVKKAGLGGLLEYVIQFFNYMKFDEANILGNSLGGHIAQLFVLKRPQNVRSLTLTGSSGLFESGMGDGYPRRGDYEYIQRKTAETFYDPKVATKELVDEVFNIVNDREKVLRIIITARSALKHNLENELSKIVCPTLLVWGKDDKITPPFVGEKFNELIPNSELVLLEKCGHAPMMEVPEEFNLALNNFLKEI